MWIYAQVLFRRCVFDRVSHSPAVFSRGTGVPPRPACTTVFFLNAPVSGFSQISAKYLSSKEVLPKVSSSLSLALAFCRAGLSFCVMVKIKTPCPEYHLKDSFFECSLCFKKVMYSKLFVMSSLFCCLIYK